MSVKLSYTLFSILILSRYCECMTGMKGKFVIDNDAGGDDAMAIFLAALFEKYHAGPQLIGVTTSNGNTNEDNVSYNNQRILKVAKRQDVPIYRGSKSSLVKTPEITDYFGKDGLGDSGDVYPDLVPPHTQNAVNALIHLSKTHEGNLTIITIGALTNLALAIKTDPAFLGRLAHVYIGAGHIHTEEYPTAEFNAHMDVEAYHVVTENANPEKVTIFPFSQVQKYCNFSREWRINVLGAINTEIIRAQNKYERISLPREDRWQALDPATVALFLRPDLVQEYKYSKNTIALCGENRGITSNSFVDKEDANVRIAYSVKTEEYRQFLLDLFSNDA